jgi:hypothetical protein
MRSEVTLRRADRIGWSGAVCAVAAAMLLVTGIAMAPAEAHRLDRVTPHRAGPIVRGDTIMRELRGGSAARVAGRRSGSAANG